MPHHFLVSNFHFFPTFIWPDECETGLESTQKGMKEHCSGSVWQRRYSMEVERCPLDFSLRKLSSIKSSDTRLPYLQTDVIQCNQTSRQPKSLCGSSLADKKETFPPKMKLFPP